MQSTVHISIFKDGLLLWGVSSPHLCVSWQQGEKGAKKTKGTELDERIEKGRGRAEEL